MKLHVLLVGLDNIASGIDSTHVELQKLRRTYDREQRFENVDIIVNDLEVYKMQISTLLDDLKKEGLTR